MAHGHSPKRRPSHMFLIILGLLGASLLSHFASTANTPQEKRDYLIALIIVIFILLSPFVAFFYIMRG